MSLTVADEELGVGSRADLLLSRSQTSRLDRTENFDPSPLVVS